MSYVKFNVIAAVSENMGLGIDGKLPWNLKSEMAYFTKMTTATKDVNKKNAVVMGRVTYDCIPEKYRPLKDRINVVISRTYRNYEDKAFSCQSISQAIEMLSFSSFKDELESVWVIGGSSIYKAAMNSQFFHRLYLTRIKKTFECDTFFPELPEDLVLVEDPHVPKGVQEENGIQFVYEVYEKKKKQPVCST